MNDIKNVTEVEMAPVRHGYWTKKIDKNDDPLFWRKYFCSECGSWWTYGMTEYCSRCGAKMDLEVNDNA